LTFQGTTAIGANRTFAIANTALFCSPASHRRAADGAEEPPQHGLARGRLGRKICVTDDEVVAMARGAQRVEDVCI